MEEKGRIKGPSLPRYILTKAVDERLHEEFIGDLSEVYEQRLKDKGRMYAKFMYWIDVLHLLVGFTSFKSFRNRGDRANIGHYTKIASRNILRQKAYSFTNIAGLSIGMGVCLIIFQYVHFELSYDQFHEDSPNIYRVIIEQREGIAEESYPNAIGYSFGEEAAQTIPEIAHFVRKERVNRTAVVTNPENNAVFYEEVNSLFFVDSSFFDVFSFPLVQGSKASLFSDKYNIVITKSVARKYFGDTDPIGKQLEISGPPSPGSYTVSGVIEDVPLNTHLQFGLLMPMTNYLEYGWGGAVKKQGGWGGFSVVTYFQLQEMADIKQVEDKLNQLIAEHTSKDIVNTGLAKKASLQPVSDIYMKSNDLTYPGHFNTTGHFENILIFSIISFVILLIAWVNYINLATSQSIRRAKEVGIRKSLGALRKQLVIQFIIESVIFNIVAAVLAIGLAYLLLPVLNQVFGKELAFDLIQLPAFWLLFIAVVLSGSILSGLYPALVLSGFKPISMLKGYRRSGKTTVLRQGLIVFQFVMSLLLLSATYLLVKQTSFMKNQDLGINLDKILIVSGPRATSDKDKSIEKFQTFRNELARHSSIHAVTGSLCVPGQFWMGAKRRPETAIENAPISRGFYVTLNFENTYDLEFLAGSPFRETMSDEEVNIINEAALSTLGFETPEDAIGQKIVDNDEERPKTIVGVVKNFHWHSLHEGHMPYILGLYENRLTENISIKLSTETLPETLEHIEATFSDFFPGNPFDYYFADTAFNNEYRAEDQFKEIFLCFTLLAIVIACVGLLALVSHSLSMKVKEIGIRKVLGAGIPGLMLLLSKEYMRLIFWAMLLSFPLVWYFGSDWLENYSYRISITFDLFIYPFMILVLITLLTISRRTFLASRTNPVDSLRMD